MNNFSCSSVDFDLSDINLYFLHIGLSQDCTIAILLPRMMHSKLHLLALLLRVSCIASRPTDFDITSASTADPIELLTCAAVNGTGLNIT